MGSIFSERMQSDLHKASQYHAELLIFSSFKSGLERAKLEASAMKHLEKLAKIYGLRCLTQDMLPVLACGYISGAGAATVESTLQDLIKQLRPQLLPLIEVLAPPDEILFSAIGSKHLHPYKTLMEWTKKYNPLNKRAMLPGFKEHILPIMQRPRL